MKQVLSIVFVFIGLVIGAGFASGREIFEYFNIVSQTDFTGIIFAVLGFAAIAYITMQLSQRLSAANFDQFIETVAPTFAPCLKLFMAVFMFCGFFVMLSASGVLFESTFSAPPGFGIALLALFCFVVFAFDIKGLVSINAVLVPLMIIGMSVLCIFSILYDCSEVFSLSDKYNSIRQNFITSAICYVSYNTITAGAVLVPLSVQVQPRKLLQAAVTAGSILGILIFLVWSALNIYYDTIYISEMPLLSLAAGYGSLSKLLYTAVLFMALCTTAVSHGFGILSKFKFARGIDRILASALLCLAAMPFAYFGFSNLIKYLYSAFGFLGLFWFGLLIYKFFKTK